MGFMNWQLANKNSLVR